MTQALRSPPLRSLAAPVLALAALASLTACATKVPDRVGKEARTPTEHFQLRAEPMDQEVRLAVHAQGLSANQAAALAQFVADWSDGGGGTITLRSPTGAADAGAAAHITDGARAFLIDQGVPADHIQVVSYDARGEPAPVLRIGYSAYRAIVPACGRTWTNIAHSATNDVQPNFGCSVTANMAAQIADPADLAHPRQMTPGDATRRINMLDKYRKGQVTSSEKDDQAKGVVSDAIK